MKSLVVTMGPFHDMPWWWEHIETENSECYLDYERMIFKGKHSTAITTLELPLVMFKVLRRLLHWKQKYDYVFTVECDLVGLSIAFWQSLLSIKRPRHVIVQFIMREKENTVQSHLKYLLLRYIFKSVYRTIVSSTTEKNYYLEVFKWPDNKVFFNPLFTAPEFLSEKNLSESDYVLSVGRTFRDYDTLLKAVDGTDIKLVIVGGKGTVEKYGNDNKMINVKEDIPIDDVNQLMRDAKAIVIPLEDRLISTGQIVMLQAMALGKAVVATRTSGTKDYITHMVDGLLVSPKSVSELRDALQLVADKSIRETLGDKARKKMRGGHHPNSYAKKIGKNIKSKTQISNE